MSNAGPLRPLIEVGDFLLQMAPHNVLARGGQVTIAPVMARQPTMYEEMSRAPAPRAAPAPAPALVQRSLTIFDAGDDILKFAPHNVLLSLLTGGQLPSAPERPKELPSSVGNFADLPTKVDITKFRTSQSGGVTYFADNMAVAINGKGSYYTVKVPSDRKFITLLYVADMKPTKIYQTGQFGWVKSGKDLPSIPRPSLPVSVPDPPGGFGFIKKAEMHTFYAGDEWKGINYWGKGEKREETGQVGPVKVYTVTEYDDRVLVYLVPPIAPSTKDVELRNKEVKEWDVRHPTVAPPVAPPVTPPPLEVPEVPAGPTPEELQAQATAEAKRKAEEEARRRDILAMEAEERRTATVEKRMKMEQEQRAAELEAKQAKAREEVAARAARRREEEQRKAEESRRQYEEFQKTMEDVRQAKAAERGEKQLKAEEVSARALELRQLAARRRLQR